MSKILADIMIILNISLKAKEIQLARDQHCSHVIAVNAFPEFEFLLNEIVLAKSPVDHLCLTGT